MIFAARVHGRQECVWTRHEPEGVDSRVDFTDHVIKTSLQIKRLMGSSIADESWRLTDPWQKISEGIRASNWDQQRAVWPSFIKALDKSMSASKPSQTIKTSNLPRISHFGQKPEPIVMELRCCARSKTGLLLHLEIQKGKAAMAQAKFEESSSQIS